MKRIIEYRTVRNGDKWVGRTRHVTVFSLTEPPDMHTWLLRDDGSAVYYCLEDEKPKTPIPSGFDLPELKLSATNMRAVRNQKKQCACANKGKAKNDTSAYSKYPTDSCIDCAEKHLGTAYALYAKESGYRELNRLHYIGELNNAQQHIYAISKEVAEKIRELRHAVQTYGQVDDDRWQQLAVELVKLKSARTGVGDRKVSRILIFSNVEMAKKLEVGEDDLLVFVNKAVNMHLYKEHSAKCVFHRSDKPEYGEFFHGVDNFYVFGTYATIPKEFISQLKDTYDWNYDIEQGKIKSCTTGYMVAKYYENLYPDKEICLVNFGFDVEKSTYRCPWHNWKFEDEQLRRFKHITA